ncbi:(2Fe-2S)-binding protein [Burkholderia gladioli]|uniref:(2Fe-2S)-binding protein n=1 Tax=Burkholderia gladioli TaxID=28095 RepID=UPI003132B708
MQARNTQPDQYTPKADTDAGIGLTRRALFRTTLAAAASVAMGRASAGESNALTSDESKPTCNVVPITVTVNKVLHRLEVRSDVTLLDLLREDLQYSGTKKGCNRGECGACTVLLDGRRVNACFVLAATLDGRAVTSIEGLAHNGELHPVQQAFIECDAFQCGFCTSGQIMSAVGCIREGHTNSNDEIREWMSGNLCRCSAYPQIAQAVASAAKALEGDAHGSV